MKITRRIAENCVSYLQGKGYSAYVHEYNNIINVCVVIDDMDLELSANEILNRNELFLEESLETE